MSEMERKTSKAQVKMTWIKQCPISNSHELYPYTRTSLICLPHTHTHTHTHRETNTHTQTHQITRVLYSCEHKPTYNDYL